MVGTMDRGRFHSSSRRLNRRVSCTWVVKEVNEAGLAYPALILMAVALPVDKGQLECKQHDYVSQLLPRFFNCFVNLLVSACHFIALLLQLRKVLLKFLPKSSQLPY